MIALEFSLFEFLRGHDVRVDFPPQPFTQARQKLCETAEPDSPDNHQINIAFRPRFASRNGAEDKRQCDDTVLQGVFKNADQAIGF